MPVGRSARAGCARLGNKVASRGRKHPFHLVQSWVGCIPAFVAQLSLSVPDLLPFLLVLYFPLVTLLPLMGARSNGPDICLDVRTPLTHDVLCVFLTCQNDGLLYIF